MRTHFACTWSFPLLAGGMERDTDGVGGDHRDFFVSHAGADRAWAEWVAWQLVNAGYTVELDVWDWAVGRKFVTSMSDALDRCDRVVALFSVAYFERPRYTTDEWANAMLHLPGIGEGRLIPLRIQDVSPAGMPAVLRALMYRDLFGIGEQQARAVLLEAVAGPQRPDQKPVFPGHGIPGGLTRIGGNRPRLPGTLPRIWNLPPRNPGFTGREKLLVQLREALLTGDAAVVQTVPGMSGVGKTQLAAEYAHQFAGFYDLAWWINVEPAGLIGDQFTALAAQLGCVEIGAPTEAMRLAVLAELRARDRWLLIFDNADTPADVVGWLPGGTGHVLITSRGGSWHEIAVPVNVYVLARAESVAILRDRIFGLSEADADRLAEQLGDLPLAITQAAAFMASSGMTASGYLTLLDFQATELLNEGTPLTYPQSLAAVTQLIVHRLTADDPAAVQLANVCAFLAPEPIPTDLFTDTSAELPTELAARAADPLAWAQTLDHLTRQSLVQVEQGTLVMHRLTQAILRNQLPPSQATATRACAEALLTASNPGDPRNPATWPSWARLMPHLLITDLAGTDDSGLRQMMCSGCFYLLARGEISAGYSLAGHLYSLWRDRLGPDDGDTLSIAHDLAFALRLMGRYPEARELDLDSLARKRRLYGDDHPSTLTSANALASDLFQLGEVGAARDLHQDTLNRRRRVLGEDHSDTLTTASDLAADLRELGENSPDAK